MTRSARAILLPTFIVMSLVLLAVSLVATLGTNLADKNIRTGFGFLFDRAGFAIGETMIGFVPSDNFAKALLVGLLNTLQISAIAIVLSTVLGLGVCFARLSTNWLVARIAGLYIEIIRNIPLLLQMFVWYALFLYALAPATDSGAARVVALDNRGLHLATIVKMTPIFWSCAAGAAAWFAVTRFSWGKSRYSLITTGAIAATGILIVLMRPELSLLRPSRFGLVGGTGFSTEFLTLVVGLSIYTSAYLSEIFRAAIQAVPLGQHEAAGALGLSKAQTLNTIILPQALRIAIPPMTSWHLNTLKNSSLGVAIGYPEFVSIVDTVISQTGQAVEGVGLIVVTFLALSLSLAFVTNQFSRRYGWSVTGQAGRQALRDVTMPIPWKQPSDMPAWVRANLFPSFPQAILSVTAIALTAYCVMSAINWLFIDATFSGGALQCKENAGACWPFLQTNVRLILFGTYPQAEQWRAILASIILLSCLGTSFASRVWGSKLALVWLGGIIAAIALLNGGFGGLALVAMTKWSGLPITLLLASIAVVAAFPLAVLLAFGRLSSNRTYRYLCVGFIEIVRGVPLIGVLFLAAVMFPLFVPKWLTIDSLPRVQLALVLFTAAYMAEAIRGGLISIPTGQAEAAQALGLGKWQARLSVTLPQALKVSLPGLANTSISEVKNTTLVLIVGVFDLLQTTRLSYIEAQWRPYYVEAYLFSGTLFFVICFALSALSMKIERKLTYEG